MMTSNAAHAEATHDEQIRALKKRDERLFQAVFFVSFPIFLVVVMATRILPSAGEAKKEKSILSEASASARSTIALALMD